MEQLEKSRLDEITSGSAPTSSGNGVLDRGSQRVLNKVKEKVHRTLPTKRHNKAIQAAENELVELMIERLGNIDIRLLDEAVGEWYRRIFSNRFASLKPEAQEEVVAGFARTIKRGPEELASSGELP